jgi:hypothetical protein
MSPRPNAAALITLRDNGVGTHSALYVDRDGKQVLYDPAGSYPNVERGSGDTLYGKDADLEAYKNFHQGNGTKVEIDWIQTTPAQDAAIIRRIEALPTAYPFTCAERCSAALGMQERTLPGNLQEDVRKIKEGK